MKKIFLGFAIAGLMSMSAVAAPISVDVAIAGFGIVAPVFNGDTSVSFTTTGPFSTVSCWDTSLCGTPTVQNVNTDSTAFADGTAITFTWDDGLSYTTSTWVSGAVTGAFSIDTIGTYKAAGYDDTQGVLNFTFQAPAVGTPTKAYSFSATGTVPEPGTMALLGMGLVGLGVMARRRRKS